jgi:hypothetical protein
LSISKAHPRQKTTDGWAGFLYLSGEPHAILSGFTGGGDCPRTGKICGGGRWQMLSDEERMNAEQDFFGDGA